MDRCPSMRANRRAAGAAVMALAALLVVPAGAAHGQTLPPFALTATPLSMDAGTSFLVEGEGCPSEMPLGYTSDSDLVVHVKPHADGPNYVAYGFFGVEGDAAAVQISTAAGVVDERTFRLESEPDGHFSFELHIPWWATDSPNWFLEVACYTLGPVTPFDQGQFPNALAATLQAPSFPVTSHTPSFDRLQPVPPLHQRGDPLPTPEPPALLSISPGRSLDVSGRGCWPPQPDDLGGTGRVAIELRPAAYEHQDTYTYGVRDGSLELLMLATSPPDSMILTTALHADGSWTASVVLPSATSALPIDLLVTAQCLSGLSAADLLADPLHPLPGGLFNGGRATGWVPIVGAAASPIVTTPTYSG